MSSAAASIGDVPQAGPAAMKSSVKFLIFGVMAFGQFMAMLDIQIVAASLNDIRAGLSAAPDEVSWIQTAYLMAELVMIPFSAFLAQAMSTGWLFAASAALFVVSSVACGLAWNIESMIAFRALQGFTGGAMIPTVFATGFTLFEGKERAMIPAILGMVSVLAPTLGPTVGGLITQALDWRWIFFINVAPGIAVTLAVIWLVRIDKPDVSMFGRIDWVHLASMATFLAGLEYVLEEGPKQGWFDDGRIAVAAWVSAVAFLLFLERSFLSTMPIVNLSPFRRPRFAFACIFNIVIGFGLFASIYLIPIYLGRVRGYDSLQIGETVFVVGIAQIISTIVAARVSQTVDRRITITVGLVMFAFSLWLSSHMNAEWGFAELFWPQAVRGLAVMLCIVPSVGMALEGFAGNELRYASGLFNLMRNLGGAIGIATVNTWLVDYTRIQAARFGESLAGTPDAAQQMMASLVGRLGAVTPDPAHAMLMAQAMMGQMVERQSLVVAFDDIFRLMSWMFIAALVMVPFCKPPEGAATTPALVEAH